MPNIATLLLRGLRQVVDVVGPLERAVAPDLLLRRQARALVEATYAQRVRRRILDRSRIHRGRALLAESLHALVAAGGGLDVNAGRSCDQGERFTRRRDRNPIRCPRKRLAVGAVADLDARRIDV